MSKLENHRDSLGILRHKQEERVAKIYGHSIPDEKNSHILTVIKEESNLEATPNQPKTPPKGVKKQIQFAQKCPWCFKYMFGGEELSTYNGAEYEYSGWMCHAECNLPMEFATTWKE
jgi:hypothetical protein